MPEGPRNDRASAPSPQGGPRRVEEPLAGRPLDYAVRELFASSWGKARGWIESGKIAVDGEVCTDAREAVHAGAEIVLRMEAPRPRRASDLAPDAIVYLDAQIVVVDKPSGVSTVPYDDSETNTLDEQVRNYLRKRERGGSLPALGIVHRIDKETSGLVVFTRTWLAKKSLASQFRAHTVHRRYLAIAHGAVRSQTFRSHLVENRGDGVRGSIEKNRLRGEGQVAVTHVEVVERLRDATLVACRLETGRTHQIRIHLSEAGNPLVGDRVYIRRFAGKPIAAPRLMLHAAELGFSHPATGEDVRWTSDAPPDFQGVAKRLRGA